MINWLHIITAVIATVATVFMAIFAWVLLKINRRQHQLDYEQELILHSCEPTLSIDGDVEPDKTGKLIHKSKPTIESHLACVLVNSSALPLVIKKIDVRFISKEGKVNHFAEGFVHDIAKTEHIYGKPSIDEKMPPGIFIKSVPWVIAGKGFTIFAHTYTSIPLEYQSGKVVLEFTYYNEYKKCDVMKSVKGRLHALSNNYLKSVGIV
jgi:hypothetical protein